MTWYSPKYYAEMRKLARAQALKQASSTRVGGPESRQAPSTNELDRDPALGYNGINKTKPPLKVSAMSAVSKAGTFRAVSPRIHAVTIKDSTVGPRTCPAASSKPQASTDEQQASNQQASNQQASRVSSTVDQEPGTTDPQA